MIYVNIFNITPDLETIQVSVETSEGSNITSLRLWTHNSFKDEALAIDLNYKLAQINNKEVFIIEAAEISSITNFSGIFFLEISSDAESSECTTCTDPMIAVTANFNNIDECILNDVLNIALCDESVFTDTSCNGNPGVMVVNKSLLLDSLCKALTAGYYTEAIVIYNKLLKLCNIDPSCPSCNTCDSCNSIGDGYINTGLGYGTLGNTLILT